MLHSALQRQTPGVLQACRPLAIRSKLTSHRGQLSPAADHGHALRVFSSADIKLKTAQTLPSGRLVKELTGVATKRNVNDLPLELVEGLIIKYAPVKQPLKLGKKKVTENIAQEIQRRWNTEDCVKLQAVHKDARSNMKGLCFEVEELTGGLVIWISGSKLLVYRDQEFNDLRKEWQAVDKKKRRIQSETSKHIR